MASVYWGQNIGVGQRSLFFEALRPELQPSGFKSEARERQSSDFTSEAPKLEARLAKLAQTSGFKSESSRASECQSSKASFRRQVQHKVPELQASLTLRKRNHKRNSRAADVRQGAKLANLASFRQTSQVKRADFRLQKRSSRASGSKSEVHELQTSDFWQCASVSCASDFRHLPNEARELEASGFKRRSTVSLQTNVDVPSNIA